MELSPEYEINLILKNRINHIFIHYIHPDNVLPHIMARSAEKGVLSHNDEDAIRAVTNNGGVMKGANELLSRLHKYMPNWFSVLLEVLRLPEVNLERLAKQFWEEKTKAREDYLKSTIAHQRRNRDVSTVTTDSTSRPNNRQNESVRDKKPLVTGTESTDDDFKLDSDGNCSCDDGKLEGDHPDGNEENNYFTSDMPNYENLKENESAPTPRSRDVEIDENSRQFKSSVPVQEDMVGLVTATTNLSMNPSGESAYAGDTTDSEGYQVVDGIQNPSSTYWNRFSSPPYNQYDEAKCLPEATSTNAASTGSGAKAKDPSRSMVKIRNKCDFSYAETLEALCNFDGWHSQQNEKSVIDTFKDILEKKLNGCYLIWFWEKKMRPAVCVSHNGKLITYIVHRRIITQDRFNYYISKDLKKESLKELFVYHMNNGLSGMKENSAEKIELREAIHPRSP